MPYGAIKVDNITFTNGGADQPTTVSGIYRAITSGVTVTGTISGVTIQGATVSGTTVTGTTANFVSGVFTTQLSGVTVTGTTASFTSGVFTALSGTTTTVTSGIFGAGSAAAPSITFSGDLNTGIYNPAADTLAFVEGGVEALRIDSSGRVGIGTTSPIGKVDVTGTNVPLIVQSTVAASNYITHRHITSGDIAYIGNGGGGALTAGTTSDYVIRANLGSLIFACNGDNERARIDSSGNVGIGTTSPLTKLEVRSGVITAGSVDAPNGAEILRGYYGTGAITVIGSEYSSGGPVIGYGVKPSTTTTDAFLSSDSGALPRGAYTIGGNIHKWYIGANQTVAENSSVSTSEVMRIDSSGRLLVGTSTASQNADRLSGNKIALVSVGVGQYPSQVITSYSANNGYTAGVIDFQKSRGSSDGSMTIVAAEDNIGAIQFLGSDGANFIRSAAIFAQVDGTPGANDMPGRLVFYTTADGAASPTERMRIDSSGNVGIGTSSPGEKLHVIGNIQVGDSGNERGIYVGATGFSGAFLYQPSGDVQLSPRSGFGIKFAPAPGSATEWGRWDSSGRLLVGTSSAFDATADAVIQAATTNGAFACLGNSDTSVLTNENLGLLRFFSRGGSVWEEGARIEAEADLDHASGDKPTRLVFSTTADGAASPTERMRISQNGNAYIGTTADLVSDTNSLHVSGTRAIVGRATGGATNPVITSWNNATSGDNVFISFRTETADTERGTIDYNRAGGQVRYNVTSDRRLKSEIQPAASALDNLAAIQVRAYKWTETDYQINYGFVAQELNEVAPDAVKEGDYGEEITNAWAVDNSKLVPLLTKALQEAIARIETLEAKVAALENA